MTRQPNDPRLGCFNTTSTRLLEDLVMSFDLEPTDDERLQASRDWWLTNLTPHYA